MSAYDKFARRITVTSAEVNTGAYVEFDQTNITFNELPKAAVASASMPGMFNPMVWPGHGIFMDGGTVFNINIESAVHQCLDLVNDESKITVDVLICNAPVEPEVIESLDGTRDAIARQHDLRKYYSATSSIV